MNEYRPPRPSGRTPAADWAQKIQDGIYGARRILHTPDTLTTHTSSGVMHRPKPAEIAESQPLDHFYFSAKWTFPNGISRADVQVLFQGVPVVAVSLTNNLSLPTADELAMVAADLGGQNYGLPTDWIDPDAGYNYVLKMPQPLPIGWVADILYRQNTVPDNAILTVMVANTPSSYRTFVGSTFAGERMPPRRFYASSTLEGGDARTTQFPSQYMSAARYYPTVKEGHPIVAPQDPEGTFLCMGIAPSPRSYLWSAVSDAEFALSFPPGFAMTVFGHAFKTEGIPNLFGDGQYHI